SVRSRQADLRRPASQLPDRIRGCRPACDRTRARGRRRTRDRAAQTHTVAEGDHVIVAEGFNVHTFANAFRFLWDDRSFVATKTLEHLQLSAISIGIAILIALPLGVWLGHI